MGRKQRKVTLALLAAALALTALTGTAALAAEEAPQELPQQDAAETQDAPVMDGDTADSPFRTDAQGNRYYLDSSGYKHTGWLYLDGLWYYFWSDGTMATGWCRAGDGYWYYFDKDTGVVHRGWITYGSDTYYMRPEDGTEQTYWRKIDGYWYYFGSSGKMATGWCKASDGYWYYFDKDTGIVHRGWIETTDGSRYYMRPEDAREQTYWREIDGYWYYFGSDGKMRTGWQYLGGEYYYFYKGTEENAGPVGSNAHDVTIDGREVLSNGAIADGSRVRMLELAPWYSSATNYLILVDTTACKTGIFYGSGYDWDLWYFWDCTPGASWSPTVTGTFTVGARGRSFTSYGSLCYWYTQFYGNYLFHSVTYNTDGTLQDGRLGMNLSHGCVRLAYDNAYWIYRNIPTGTKVVVY